MVTITCRIPEKLDAAIGAQARHRRVPKAVVMREALTRQVRRGTAPRAPTAFDVARSLCGSLQGPRDLSSNPRHLEDLGA
jgi:hypothetical protein